ncbi:unnamed protein product [Coffea canephora]|uniref:Probable Ufm1-specific protease n=2 Tax=Coffea TaxID=13442 RepID=A0A068V3D6_COFCA|nr:probable Ufm1-specific protease isoform X1 [Coffea arabica]CDP15077.1 unnamed protein product [Coffea canephora]
MDTDIQNPNIRILCRKLVLPKLHDQSAEIPQIQWLIGSPFFPSPTIIATIRCINSADFSRESDDIRILLPKGFEVIGALIVKNDPNFENSVGEAVDAAVRLRKLLYGDAGGGFSEKDQALVGGVVDLNNAGDVQFFTFKTGNVKKIEKISSVLYEEQPEKYVWERGCLLQCELPIKFPVYYPAKNLKEVEKMYIRATEVVASNLVDLKTTYIMEANGPSAGEQPVVLSGTDLELHKEMSSTTSQESKVKTFACSDLCLKAGKAISYTSIEEYADIIHVSILSNRSKRSLKPAAPIAEYYPAVEDTKVLVVDHKLEVLCYAAKDLSLAAAVSKLIIPALVDQILSMRNKILSHLLTEHPQLQPYHFVPPGFFIPITVFYELSYGEMEMKQVETRKALHIRFGLPLDRPLLRVVNAINLSVKDNKTTGSALRKGSSLLKDVHLGIPSSGVSGGTVSLIQGSYEYYHYLLDGFDDSGWGCAYRSLQTIVSWFRLQHYSGIDVPSHREIQQTLVEIGDKDPSFIGSREWIGAIELSFVLDKLLGVSCKVINVRSGAELPEKCRELALHFDTQGTPVMIGGGVLAYTLLGVDYNEVSGDCAFLILDPHYTGTDDLKRIVSGGWCGWKKAIDSKGKHFFLHDKFYNLLLPQRPNTV